ncbi:uncharacterized protein F5147DRAFT_808757 [Suillus discolor]|uniref:DUF6533 domain-containing protein n=1 Tax=Suillus discolor TaxID=1912936 RepID=A0A9P7F3B4_9AGAM|nr:uncharacterized protein F5147DRAFT_808757 [Suillus discolor]KAG2103774.1 hypothetical protein F5147DRAFT_808757 [Suillus discolor]
MTYVSNDQSWWPKMILVMFLSYWEVAAGVVVVYDWVLTFGQEIELIWRQRWSLMTVLYLIIRYIAIPFSVLGVLRTTTFYASSVTIVVLTAMLGVIMIARLHAMYQGSRTMLVFLVITFLAVNIACAVITVIVLMDTVGEEAILSGTYMCNYEFEVNAQLLFSTIWILNTVWEILAFCLSVWVAVKHFRELRRLNRSTGSTIGDCFGMLIQSHVLYFASFVGVSCLQLACFSEVISSSTSMGAGTLDGVDGILSVVQMFVLGPRLILSVREYNAKLVAYSDVETNMNSIVFQERVHVSTGSTV